MDLAQLAGRGFGPHRLWVSPDGVTDFVTATGDNSERWTRAAPPGFMSVALFAVAPDLLALLYEQSVIHGEQSFTWHRPFQVGAELAVGGTVTKVRERGGVHFITFEMEAYDDDGVVATGSALFLAAGESTPVSATDERDEPAANDRGDPGDGQLAASRSDLVRYAAATRDWNPIHWDHAAAVEAGLPGIVAHGLLQASWALRTATEPTTSDRPLANSRVRFRSPLPAATPVDVTAEWSDANVAITLSDVETEYVSARIELADG